MINPEHYSIMTTVNPAPAHGELAVLFSGEGRPRGGHKVGPAVHDYYLVHTVVSGEGLFVSGGTSYPCKAGDTFVIFPGELFSYEADAGMPWHYVWAAFVGHAGESVLASIGVTPRHPVVRGDGHKLLGIYRRMRNTLQHAETAGLADLEASGLLRLLLHGLGRANLAGQAARLKPPTDIERQVEHAIRWLTVQFTQQISIEGMSRSLGYHRTHLSKMFKRATGLSPMQYLLKLRMERAMTLLEGTLTVEQVAASVGFGDALYFSKQFRKWTGRSPSAYREMLRGRGGAQPAG